MDKSTFVKLFLLFLAWLFTNVDMISDTVNAMDLLGFDIFNSSIMSFFVDDNRKPDSKPDYIWGYVSIVFVMAPGFAMTLVCLARLICGSRLKCDMEFWTNKIIPYFFWPVTVFLYPLVLLCAGANLDEYRQFSLLIASVETFVEAVMQSILQIFIVINRNYFSTLQVISMAISFITISKTMIEYDLSEYVFNNDISFSRKLGYIVTILPVYATCLIFRCTSFGIILAHFRLWSFIPAILYVFILFILITTAGFHCNTRRKLKVCFTNLAVLSLGENDIVDCDATKRYTFRSAIASYVYLTICLLFILISILYRWFPISLPETLEPVEMEVWKCLINDNFLLLEFSGTNFSHFVQMTYSNESISCDQQGVSLKTNIKWMVIPIIVLGTVNILLVLFASGRGQFKMADDHNPASAELSNLNVEDQDNTNS